MSQFNRRDLSEKTKKLQKEISNSSPLWGKTVEEEQRDIKRVKKKWQEKQYRQYHNLQHQQKEQKNIKTVISSLVTITIMALIIPHLPHWWQLTANLLNESSSPEKEKITPDENKGTFFTKLKELSDKQSSRQTENETLLNNPSISCDSDASQCASTQNSLNGKVNLEDKLVDSLDKINQHNNELQKAIEMSDGENVSLEEK